jgi:hypothetical protein
LSAARAVEESDNLQTLRSCHGIVTPGDAMPIRISWQVGAIVAQ